MTDANPRRTLTSADAVLGDRHAAPARRRAAPGRGRHVFSQAEAQAVEIASTPLRALVDAGRRVRGNVLSVEQLLARYVSNRHDRHADVTLDWVDVRDLVAVARTIIDARLFGEIERRIGRRGKYQRGRAANLLGFSVRLRTSARSGEPVGSPIFGG